MDSILSYDEHVTQTVSSCIGSLCQINRVKHLFDARTLERVINALVFSKLYYCSPVWSNTSKKNFSKLQKEFCLQNHYWKAEIWPYNTGIKRAEVAPRDQFS